MEFKIISSLEYCLLNWDEFEELIRNSFRKIQYSLNTYTKGYELDRKIWGKENFINNIKNGAKLVLMYKKNELVGTATLTDEIHMGKKSLCLTKFAVKEIYRGNNYGEKIIEFCTEVAKNEQYEWMTLYTSELLNKLVRYYKNNGFIEYRKIKVNQFGIEYNRVFFEKKVI